MEYRLVSMMLENFFVWQRMKQITLPRTNCK